MCVSERAILEEFGKEAIFNGCRTIYTNSEPITYCVCAQNECNKISILEQVVIIICLIF